MRRLRQVAGAVALLVGSAIPSRAQFGERTGPEFLVNSSVGGSRSTPRVGMAADGRFFVIWSGSSSDESGQGIVGRRFDATGTPVGSEFQVNSTVAGDQSLPDIAMNAAGAAVAVWQSMGQDGSGWGIYGQRYDGTGSLVGPEFRVNSTVAGDQDYPSVAMDGLGRFVVVWRGVTSAGPRSIFGQRFDSSGSPSGIEFEVGAAGTYAAGTSVAMNASGRFVVAWSDSAARTRSYDESGTALGPATSYYQVIYSVHVGIDDTGRFVMAFADGAGGPSHVASYDAGGGFLSDATLSSNFRFTPTMATNRNGDSLVIGLPYSGSTYAQTFAFPGDARTWPLRVNPAVPSDLSPSLAIGGPDLSAVVFARTVSTGVVDIYARRYGPPVLTPTRFYTLGPCRIFDTRGYVGPYFGMALYPGTPRLFAISNPCGLPLTAKAIAVNMTVTQPTAAGYLTFLPGGTVGSAINYGVGETRANSVVLPVDVPEGLWVRCVQANGSVHFILDVVGFFE